MLILKRDWPAVTAQKTEFEFEYYSKNPQCDCQIGHLYCMERRIRSFTLQRQISEYVLFD